MADKSKPRRGSMGYSPRKRAVRQFARISSWPEQESSEVRIQGFSGWKAGMTHILMRDNNPNSTSAGQEIRKAVTVVEAPPMKVLAVRGYRNTPYGMQTAGEVWADPSDSGPEGLMPRLANDTKGKRDAEDGKKPEKRAGRIPIRNGENIEKSFEALKSNNLCEIR
jgi:large subunit ribosomal protein L3